METLQVLEQKVAKLIGHVKELKAQNEVLEKEKQSLQEKVEELEISVLNQKESDKEKALTREVVDELIKSIDSLVGNEDQP